VFRVHREFSVGRRLALCRARMKLCTICNVTSLYILQSYFPLQSAKSLLSTVYKVTSSLYNLQSYFFSLQSAKSLLSTIYKVTSSFYNLQCYFVFLKKKLNSIV
jgi:hypothetical protein